MSDITPLVSSRSIDPAGVIGCGFESKLAFQEKPVGVREISLNIGYKLWNEAETSMYLTLPTSKMVEQFGVQRLSGFHCVIIAIL